MTAPISTAPSTTAVAPDPAASTALGKAALNKNDFLQMLVAQLKNQDPMNPMQGTEFATQLAQFSSVEQLIHLNEKMDAQSSVAQQTANTTLGVSMVGRNVILPGNSIDVIDGEMPQVTMFLPAAATELTVQVIDAAGKTAGTQVFTSVGSGRQSFDLGDLDLKPGQFSYKVTAKAADGTSIKGTTYSTARVQGMSTSTGEVLVRVNGTMMPVSQIIEVLAPASAPVKKATTTTGATTP